MTKFYHIVQVHPVYNGIVQTHKVKTEFEFDAKHKADQRVKLLNDDFEALNLGMKAVYVGCVNDETGELV